MRMIIAIMVLAASIALADDDGPILFAQATVTPEGEREVRVGVDVIALGARAEAIRAEAPEKGFWSSVGSAVSGSVKGGVNAAKNHPVLTAATIGGIFLIGDNNDWGRNSTSGGEVKQTGNDADSGAIHLEGAIINAPVCIAIIKGGDSISEGCHASSKGE